MRIWDPVSGRVFQLAYERERAQADKDIAPDMPS